LSAVLQDLKRCSDSHSPIAKSDFAMQSSMSLLSIEGAYRHRKESIQRIHRNDQLIDRKAKPIIHILQMVKWPKNDSFELIMTFDIF
jgi:hypothetical protein